jgi:hypothetical protein
VHVCIIAYVCIYIYVCLCIYTCVCLYNCVRVYIYVCRQKDKNMFQWRTQKTHSTATCRVPSAGCPVLFYVSVAPLQTTQYYTTEDRGEGGSVE